MASEGDTDCRPRITFLVGGYEQGGRSPFKKAQNDVLLVSNVGLRVTPVIVRYHSFSQRLGELRMVLRKYLEWLVD